jgi:branched-chain amino acid aminotransferase
MEGSMDPHAEDTPSSARAARVAAAPPFRDDLQVWMDGEFCAWREATVHVMAHVLHYGSSVFEGIRCYRTPHGPAVFRLAEHVRRLYESARIYRMQPAVAPAEFAAAILATIRRNGFAQCYVRPLVYRGLGTAGVSPLQSPTCSAIVCWDWGVYLGHGSLEEGIDVCVSSWTRPAPNTLPMLAKAGANYMNGALIKMEAVLNGYAGGIALDATGFVSEGSGENVFVVRDGVLRTPPLSAAVLPGITRDSILTLARDEGLQVREENLPREALYVADEVFLTGTATEVAPVRSVDRIPVGDGTPGPPDWRLQQRFLRLVHGEEIDRHGWLTAV